MSKISKQPQKSRDFIVGMLAAVLLSLIFWGLLSLWYSGHGDTDYKLTPVLFVFAMPVHVILLVINLFWFRANDKRLIGFTLGGVIASMLDLAAIWGSGFVISSTFSLPLDTVLLLSQVLLAWASILFLLMLV
jgi:hypothetical protein